MLLVTRFEPFSRSEFSTRKSFETCSPCCAMADRQSVTRSFVPSSCCLPAVLSRSAVQNLFRPALLVVQWRMADRQSVADCKGARTQRKRTARNANRQQSVTDRRRHAGTQARRHAGTQAPRDLTHLVGTSCRLRRRLVQTKSVRSLGACVPACLPA